MEPIPINQSETSDDAGADMDSTHGARSVTEAKPMYSGRKNFILQ
jgi:hypothetical protein